VARGKELLQRELLYSLERIKFLRRIDLHVGSHGFFLSDGENTSAKWAIPEAQSIV
jgi:hypothetical protein